MFLDPGRVIGKTAQQMRNAAPGAVFVWCNADRVYPRRLAEKLGRTDLIIRTPGEVAHGRLRGHLAPEIVVDHACVLTPTLRMEVDAAQTAVACRAARKCITVGRD